MRSVERLRFEAANKLSGGRKESDSPPASGGLAPTEDAVTGPMPNQRKFEVEPQRQERDEALRVPRGPPAM